MTAGDGLMDEDSACACGCGGIPTPGRHYVYHHNLRRDNHNAKVRIMWFPSKVAVHEPNPPWMGDAACVGADPDFWFPPVGGTGAEAKAICARCPVLSECADYALADSSLTGIWGGMSMEQRMVVRRMRRRIKLTANTS